MTGRERAAALEQLPRKELLARAQEVMLELERGRARAADCETVEEIVAQVEHQADLSEELVAIGRELTGRPTEAQQLVEGFYRR